MVENKQDRDYEQDKQNQGEMERNKPSPDKEGSKDSERIGEGDQPVKGTGLEREDE